MGPTYSLVSSISIVTQLIASTYAGCNTFKPISGSGDRSSTTGLTYTSSAQPIRISEIISCADPASVGQNSAASCDPSQCYLAPVNNLLFNIDSTLNITTSSDQESSEILALVKQSIPEIAGSYAYNFNLTQTYTLLSTSSVCLGRNQTEYFAFIPSTLCSTGSLDDCSGEGAPADGTIITACGIITQGQRSVAGIPIPNGIVTTENANSSGAAPAPANASSVITNIPTNSSNSPNPSDSSSPTNTSGSSSNSGLPPYHAMNGVWVKALLVTAMFFGIL